MMEKEYYLFSRGYYFRPDACGYTGIKSEAGLFTKEYAENYCLCEDVTMKHRDDPSLKEYMPSTYQDLVVKDIQKKLDDLKNKYDLLLDAFVICGEEKNRLKIELSAVYKKLNDSSGD